MTTTSSAPNSRPSSRGSVPLALLDAAYPRPGSTPPVTLPNSGRALEDGRHLISLDLFTPPDRLIPGTGGSYQDWEYHPSRREASRARAAEALESDGQVSKFDVFTQTRVVDNEREYTSDTANAASDSDAEATTVRRGSIATIILHDGDQVVSHITWDCTPLDCFRGVHDPKNPGPALPLTDTK